MSHRNRKRHQREDKERLLMAFAKEQLNQSATHPSSSPSIDTVIKQLVPFFYTFATHPSSSKVGLSEQLYNTHHNILAKPNNFPDSYSKALTLIRPYLIKQEQYIVCPNDCQFFHSNTQTECSFCNSSSKSPKRFRRMPLKDRLIRMYGTQNLAHIAQATHLRRNTDVLTDIHDTDDWANWFSANGIFAGDSRGLVFGFCTDGMDPFAHHNSKTYSMWPIVLCLYNLPKEFRMSPAFLLLWGIVPPKPHGKEPNTDIYMELLVSELIELTEYPVYDAYRRAPFALKVRLLRFILDFPGISTVFHMVGNNGIRACHWCSLKGCRCADVPKTVYLDNRAYLYPNHPIHNDKSFPNADSGQHPEPISLSYALSSRAKYTHAKTKRERDEVAKETGFKGVYPMIRLPDHNIHEQSWPDPMHTLKNVNCHIMRLLTSRISTDQTVGNDHWTLKTEELKRADERAQRVRFPPGFGLSAGQFFGNTGKSISDSHGHKQFAVTSIIQFCLRGALGSAQRKTLFNFYGVLSDLYAETHLKRDLPGLINRVNEALALLERDFPSHLQNITTHILRHIADSLHRFGPVYSSWMYPFERFNSWIHRRAALNRANPEATVMETYAIYDWCVFMMISGQAEPPNNCPEYDTLLLTKFQRYLDECRKGVPTKTTNTRHHTEEISEEEKNIILKEYSQHYSISPSDISITSEISIFNRLQIICPITKRPILFHSSFDNYSVVHVIIGDIPKFGKVSTLFTHVYKDTHQWAKIDWLPEPELDEETQIWHTSPDPVFQTCVPLAALSKPHVTAVDEGRLWILSQYRYPQKRYFFDGSHLCLSKNQAM